MKKLLCLLLLIPNLACATLTVNKIPMVKTGGSAPVLDDSDVTDVKGVSVTVGVPLTATLTGNASTATALASTPTKCNAGYFPLGVDTGGNAQNCTLAGTGGGGNNLNLTAGTYINGSLCGYSYVNSTGYLNCNVSTSGIGSVTSVAVSSPLTGGPITSSGTISIPAATTSVSGYLTSANWNTFNGKQNTITLTTTGTSGASTFSGGTLNIPNYATGGGGGSGTVTSTSVVTANGISGSVANATTTPAITLTPNLYMTGINWSDAPNLTSPVNWTQVNLITKSTTTTGTGVGFVQFWNAAKTFFFNQSVNSAIGASYGINWPAVAPTTDQVLQAIDGSGTLNWENASLLNNSAYTSNGLLMTGSIANSYGYTAINNNASGISINFAENNSGQEGGVIETGSSYTLPSAFGVGTFNSQAMYFIINGSPIGVVDTGGDLGIGTTNPAYYNYEGGGQIIDVTNQEFQGNFMSTVSNYGGGISIGQDTGYAVVSGARIGKIEFSGPIDGTGIAHGYSSAGIASYATENWNSSSTGSDLVFQTTPNGSVSRTTVLTLGPSGSMTLANASSSAVGHAACWTTGGQAGYCTSTPTSGSCSCTGL